MLEALPCEGMLLVGLLYPCICGDSFLMLIVGGDTEVDGVGIVVGVVLEVAAGEALLALTLAGDVAARLLVCCCIC
jgi:hypothetical protein